jgi:hypothetical protein
MMAAIQPKDKEVISQLLKRYECDPVMGLPKIPGYNKSLKYIDRHRNMYFKKN